MTDTTTMKCHVCAQVDGVVTWLGRLCDEHKKLYLVGWNRPNPPLGVHYPDTMIIESSKIGRSTD